MTPYNRTMSERAFRSFILALPIILVLVGLAILLFSFRVEAHSHPTSVFINSVAESADEYSVE